MMPKRNYWTSRRVFLTGHTDFKGSWLSLWLEALGAPVTGYALPPPTQPSLFEQVGVAKPLRSIFGDIRDFDRLKKASDDCRPLPALGPENVIGGDWTANQLIPDLMRAFLTRQACLNPESFCHPALAVRSS